MQKQIPYFIIRYNERDELAKEAIFILNKKNIAAQRGSIIETISKN